MASQWLCKGLLVILSAVGLYKVYQARHTLSPLVICTPEILTNKAQEAIGAFFVQERARLKDDRKALASLVSRFTCVNNATVLYKPFVCELYLEPVMPFCCINKQLVMHDKGRLLIADYFKQSCLADLYALSVNESLLSDERECLKINKWITCQDDQLFNAYKIYWHKATAITLTDKKDAYFSIVCTDQTLLHDRMKACCLQLKQKIDEKPEEKRSWMVDARFSNQIVLSYCHPRESGDPAYYGFPFKPGMTKKTVKGEYGRNCS